MPDILEVIRAETRSWHEAVERLVPVFDERFTLDEYQRLLSRFYGFYARYELLVDRVAGLAEILPDWPERRRLPLLEADLQCFGHSKSDLEKLPVCEFLRPFPSAASVLGALYVTEGSTLGGRVICRQLARSLELGPERGAAFFNGHAEGTGAKWRTFTQTLSALATATTEREIIESAVDTFKSFGTWLANDSKQHESFEQQHTNKS